MKNYQLLVLLLMGLLLGACRDDDALIQQIQQNYDKKNPSGKQAFCALIGYHQHGYQYPYTTVNLDWDQVDQNNKGSRFDYSANKTLNSRLALFSRLGLFSQQLISPATGEGVDNAAIYRYDLTDEGRKYAVLWVDAAGFCFGRRQIEQIMSDRQDKDNWGSTVTSIDFTYTVEGLPEWAKDPEVIRKFRFESFGLYTDGRISEGTLQFHDSSNGLKITGGPSSMWLFR